MSLAWFIYLTFLGLVVFWPTPVDKDFSGALKEFLLYAQQEWGTFWLTYDSLEFTANIFLLLPMGILISASATKSNSVIFLAIAFSSVLLVEVTQKIALPERYSSVLDILANTLGILIGYLLGRLTRHSRQTLRKNN